MFMTTQLTKRFGCLWDIQPFKRTGVMTDHIAPGHIMDSYDIDEVLDASYNFWTT